MGAPKKPLVPPGKTTVVNVPRGAPGTTIQVPYPGMPGAFIAVNVPKSAKPGQARPCSRVSCRCLGCNIWGSCCKVVFFLERWVEYRAKVAAGTAAVVGVGAAAVGGAVLG